LRLFQGPSLSLSLSAVFPHEGGALACRYACLKHLITA
jgi:hypothetical protein